MTNILRFIVLLLLTLTSCTGFETIEIDKNISAGFYQESHLGKDFLNALKQKVKLDTSNVLSLKNVDVISKSKDDGMYSLNFLLDAEGSKMFEEMSSSNKGKQLHFVINDRIYASPLIHTTISDGMISLVVVQEKEIDNIISQLKK